MKALAKYMLGAGLAVSMALTSCVGDLDVPPQSPNQDTPEKKFAADPRGTMDALLAEIYQGVATAGNNGAGSSILGFGDAGAGTFTRTVFNLEEMTTDHYSWLQFNDAGYYELVTLNLAEDNEIMYAAYSRIYAEIALCNELIRTIEKYRSYLPTQADQDAADDYIRQAKIMRSLAYFYAIDCFGDAGYVDETAEAGAAPAQMTRAELYDKVVNTLEEVSAEYGNQYTAPAYGYVGKECADALLSRFYLNAGVYTGTPAYDKCWAISQKIIAHHQNTGGYNNSGLADSYIALFGANNHEYAAQGSRTNEIIWTVPQDGLKLQAYGGSTFYICTVCGSYDGISSIDDCNLNAQWTCMVARQQLSERFGFDDTGYSDDMRASLWKTSKDGFKIDNLTIMGNAGYGQGYAPLKYTNYAYDEWGNIDLDASPDANNSFSDADWTVIRLAEIYLNAAESNIVGNAGNQAQAMEYVNNIRGRAGLQDWTVSQMTQQNILDERSRELYGENIRRTDLVRFNQFAGGAYNWVWKGGTHDGVAIDAHYNLFPIPNKVISFQAYRQNPGY